ncbi:MAG: hypothetical protein AAGF76_04890 [Pseudomonadota bacterium]
MKIILPDGTWYTHTGSIARICEEDCYSEPRSVLRDPRYWKGLAAFDACFCGSAQRRFERVFAHVAEPHICKADLFDHNRVYAGPEALLASRPEDERTVCDAFSKEPRHDFKRLRQWHTRRVTANTDLVAEKLVPRAMWLGLARKVFLVRLGITEFCEPFSL